MEILKQINSPDDLKKLDKNDRIQLAQEIRDFLLDVISKTGGHLGSNLGVVELSLAIHSVFNSPKDRIIFDVGHQSYVHKILTGRRDQMSTIRQWNGLCGFTKPDESEHDTIIAGHAGTSISNAVGVAAANKIKGNNRKVISVTGDAAFTSGMVYEALNNAGALDLDLIVILNANNMSISPNVGAIHKYFTRFLSTPVYNSWKNKIEDLIDHIPGIGPTLVKTSHKIEEGIKGVFVPGTIFEELGFKYLGPIDGHDTEFLIETLNAIKDLKGPILLHAVTQKGKGYHPAEEHHEKSHGVTPFIIETGKAKKAGTETYSKAFGDILTDIAGRDSEVVAITAAMTSGTGLTKFAQTYPKRFFDTGIAEQHAVTFAAGLAKQELKPVVAIYSTFLQRGYDQVLHDVSIAKLPVTFVLDRSGLVGDDGPTHHGVFDISYLRCIPNLKIIQPRDRIQLEKMLQFGINYQDGPIAIRMPRGEVPASIGNHENEFQLGKFDILKTGKDLSIITYADMLSLAKDVSDLLEKNGVSAEIVDACSIKPLDEVYLSKISKTHQKCVTIENHVLAGGFGSHVLEYFEKSKLDCKVSRFGIPDEFIEHGNLKYLFEHCGLTAENICEQVLKELLNTNTFA